MATPIPENRARFTLAEILSATGGALVRTAEGIAPLALGVVSDSRAVREGSLFVALRGENHDGHDFLEDAVVRKRASVVLVERGRAGAFAERTGPVVSVVEVADTLVAWGLLAKAHLERWRARSVDPRVVAITGSAGKTTTKELTAAILACAGPLHFTAGNLNNRVGVPATIFGLEETHRFAVLEMGMSLPGELDAITSFARPDVAIVTNVGVAHAEGVGGKEGVMREKGAVYRALADDGVAVVNADDPFVVRAAEGTRARVATFGRTEGAQYRLLSRDAGRVTIARPAGMVTCALPVPGEAAAVDLAAALAAQEAASGDVLRAASIDAALARVKLAGRSALRLLARDIVLLDDTYNANPASMLAAFETLKEVGEGRRLVAVIGEMKELGALAEAEHDALGDALAGAGITVAIGCGGLATRALERARTLGVTVFPAGSTKDAAEAARRHLRSGDAVLVKGSRGVRAEEVVAAILSIFPEVLPDSPKSALSESR
jgi:UDP-N-acetylmuramoyl-tripeptide--D-alanyl-D-alanine ligase